MTITEALGYLGIGTLTDLDANNGSNDFLELKVKQAYLLGTLVSEFKSEYNRNTFSVDYQQNQYNPLVLYLGNKEENHLVEDGKFTVPMFHIMWVKEGDKISEGYETGLYKLSRRYIFTGNGRYENALSAFIEKMVETIKEYTKEELSVICEKV